MKNNSRTFVKKDRKISLQNGHKYYFCSNFLFKRVQIVENKYPAISKSGYKSYFMDNNTFMRARKAL